MKRLSVWLCSLLSVILLPGCATITNGPSQEVFFYAVPGGASVSVDGIQRGVTPTSAILRRKTAHYATFSKECYRTQDIPFNRQLQFGKVFIGNFFSWDLPGVITDLASGSAYRINPSVMEARLTLRDDGESCLDYLALADYGYLRSLQAATPEELRGILQLIRRPNSGWRIVQLDLMANRIAKDSNSMDLEAQEAIAPLCKEFERSGYGRYKIFLYDIAAGAVHPRLKKMAAVAAASLPDNKGDLPNYQYSSDIKSPLLTQGGQE